MQAVNGAGQSAKGDEPSSTGNGGSVATVHERTYYRRAVARCHRSED